MKINRSFIAILSLICFVYIFNDAYADTTTAVNTNTLDVHFLDILKNKIILVGKNITDKALTLLLTLAVINISVVGIRLLFRGANFNEFLLETVKLIMVLGFFIFVIQQGPSTFINASQDFIGIVKDCSSGSCGSTDLSDFIFDLMQYAGVFITQANISANIDIGFTSVDIVTPLVLAAVTILTALIIVAIAANMIITVVKSWFVLTAGIFAVGFGGLSFTNQYAINYLKGFISLSFQIMAIAFIGEIVIEIASSISIALGYDASVGVFNGASEANTLTLLQAINILCLFVILFLIATSVPKAISELVQSGSVTPSAMTAAMVATMAVHTGSSIAKDVGKTYKDGMAIAKAMRSMGASLFDGGQNTDIDIGKAASTKENLESSTNNSTDSNPIRDKTLPH